MNSEKLFDTVVAHAKNSGFVYQGSEIYGGLANTWDFGPLGVELKENIKKPGGAVLFRDHHIMSVSNPLS